jgi:diacylglycerol O-acyltransferase
MIPLYTAGHQMLAGYPMPPPLWGMGINCGVMSYNGRLYFGLVADGQAAPDVERLRDFLDQSYVELRAAAGVRRPADSGEQRRAVESGQAVSASGGRLA